MMKSYTAQFVAHTRLAVHRKLQVMAIIVLLSQ